MFNRIRAIVAAGLVVGIFPATALAHGTAHVVLAEASPMGQIRIRLEHVTSAPYRSFVLADPPRLVFDRMEEGISGLEALSLPGVVSVASGALDDSWHRTIVTFARPMMLSDTVPRDDELTLVLRPTDAESLRAAAAVAPPTPQIAPPAPPRAKGDRPRIVIDPGHGGVDPGARRAGVEEKDLTLEIARAVQKSIEKTGLYEVLLTRQEDRFVLLDDRVAFARAAKADLFLSLHVNTVEVGDATGATVHIPADGPADAAAAALAVIENRSDADAGAPVAVAEDDIAQVLHAMARPVTRARSKAAANALVRGLRAAGITLHRRAIKRADFRVLRAPDVPSLLIELGFLTNAAEREQLQDPAWQARVAEALAQGIDEWIAADAAFLSLMQQ